jgi:hypothetical protein
VIASPKTRVPTAHRALLAALLACAASCASARMRPTLDPDAYPGVLREPASLARDVVWRQRVTAAWGDERHAFDAVVQVSGDTLTVVGLAPTGSTGFAVVLRHGELELVNRMPEPLPIPPRFILLDVQRALYPWLPGGPALRASGEHQADVDGEHVVETWRDGRLRERRFTRLDRDPRGVGRSLYEGGHVPGTMPPSLTLENGWFGYRLDVVTLEETLLPGSGQRVP